MARKLSLLESAQLITRKPRNIEVQPEEIEIAIAWMQGDVTITQCARALNKPVSGVQSRFAVILREAYREGVLRIVKE